MEIYCKIYEKINEKILYLLLTKAYRAIILYMLYIYSLGE